MHLSKHQGVFVVHKLAESLGVASCCSSEAQKRKDKESETRAILRSHAILSLSRSSVIVRRGCRQRDSSDRHVAHLVAGRPTPRPRRYSAAVAGNTGRRRPFGRRLAQCLPEVCPQCSRTGGRGSLSGPLHSLLLILTQPGFPVTFNGAHCCKVGM